NQRSWSTSGGSGKTAVSAHGSPTLASVAAGYGRSREGPLNAERPRVGALGGRGRLGFVGTATPGQTYRARSSGSARLPSWFGSRASGPRTTWLRGFYPRDWSSSPWPPWP